MHNLLIIYRSWHDTDGDGNYKNYRNKPSQKNRVNYLSYNIVFSERFDVNIWRRVCVTLCHHIAITILSNKRVRRWPIITFLIAERLRNLGKYTFSDVVSYRLQQAPVRSFAATSTLVVVALYLIAQMVGAGKLIQLLFSKS